MYRKIRTGFYLFSVASSGVCLCAMFVLILLQVAARFMGSVIPSSEDFAGWLLSATFFLGLAYTFKTGGHIRMRAVLSKLPKDKQFVAECVNIVIGLLITGFFAFYTSFTVYESIVYDEVSDTFVAVPLWIVQMPMAIGCVCLCIALFEALLDVLRGQFPQYSIDEALEE